MAQSPEARLADPRRRRRAGVRKAVRGETSTVLRKKGRDAPGPQPQDAMDAGPEAAVDDSPPPQDPADIGKGKGKGKGTPGPQLQDASPNPQPPKDPANMGKGKGTPGSPLANVLSIGQEVTSILQGLQSQSGSSTAAATEPPAPVGPPGKKGKGNTTPAVAAGAAAGATATPPAPPPPPSPVATTPPGSSQATTLSTSTSSTTVEPSSTSLTQVSISTSSARVSPTGMGMEITGSPDVFPSGPGLDSSKSPMTAGNIAGITLGTVAAFVLAIAAVYFFFRRKRQRLPQFDIVKPPRRNSRWRRTLLRRSTRSQPDETNDSVVDDGDAESVRALPNFEREGPPTVQEWDNSKTAFRLPPANIERPKRTLRKSIAQFMSFGAVGLNTVPEEDEKSTSQRDSSPHSTPRSTIRSITSMFFRASKVFNNRGSTSQQTNRTSQVSNLSEDAEDGSYSRASLVSAIESEIESPRATMYRNKDSFTNVTPLSHPSASSAARRSDLKTGGVAGEKTGLPFISLRPLPDPMHTFPEPPSSPTGDSDSGSSIRSIPVDAEKSASPAFGFKWY